MKEFEIKMIVKVTENTTLRTLRKELDLALGEAWQKGLQLQLQKKNGPTRRPTR